MFVWSKKLYIGEQAEKKAKNVQQRLEKGRLVAGFFLITRPSNESNLFDILPTTELMFPYYKRREIFVYGLAKGREEAEQMVLTMLEDVYRETDGLRCKEYFESE